MDIEGTPNPNFFLYIEYSHNKEFYKYLNHNTQDIIKWLKSLRPHWKPSEEQMMALEKAIVRAHRI